MSGLGGGQLAIDDMQVGATDAAGCNTNRNLARTEFSAGELLHRERPA